MHASRLAWDTPLAEWKPAAIERFWRGDGNEFAGLLTLLEKEYATATEAADAQSGSETFRGEVTCAACGGARLRPEAPSVRLARQGDSRDRPLERRPMRERFFAAIAVHARRRADFRADRAREIAKRLRVSGHSSGSTISRSTARPTRFSGGELQRVRLATGIGSGLVGVCYVLDEPSIGLHPRDNQRLIESLRDLQQQGNTVLVVEHDEAMMRQADYLIDIGPGAGMHGGQIVAAGTPEEVQRQSGVDHRQLSCRRAVDSRADAAPESRQDAVDHDRRRDDEQSEERRRARSRLGVFTCVTGVSGSGKSSLVERDACARPSPGG